jgi:hypothetical protein
MAYDNPTPSGGDDMDSADMAPTGNSGAGQDGMGQDMEKANTIHVAATDLPKGVEPKAGTKVMFCITGPPDAEGDCPGYFETSDHDEEAEEKGTSWEEDFRKSMSPRAGGGESQQEPM